MANATARWSFCSPSSTFFAFVVFLLCFSSVVATSGHSIVLQKRNGPLHQLAVREIESPNLRDTVVFTTVTKNTIFVTTTILSGSASVTPTPFAPISSPKPSASSSLSPSSEASASVQTTPGTRSASTTASSFSVSTSSRGTQRPSGSDERFTPSSAPPASKIPSATPSSSVLPSQPFAPASVNASNPIPATTLFIPTNGFASIPSVTHSVPIGTSTITTSTSAFATPTPVVAAAANSARFWNNKGAVAAVFVIVSLVAVGALIVAFITLRKRQRARKLREDHADLWEKFSDHSRRTRSNSPGPSINAAPLDAFAVRDESYIPTSREAGFGRQHSTSFYSSTPVQHPDYYPDYPPTSSQQTFATPPMAAPSAAVREPVGRASYQQSIDSFYGATGRAL